MNCIIEKVGTTTNIYYTYQDYLGSLLTVTNATGTVVMEQNFDAWGRNRNTTDWTYNNIATPTLAWQTRGYTGHEHLPVFGLINMNSRLYDPLLGRMLSPDNYTQGGSQGYNRYSYAMNNPLKYTDPDGQNPALVGFVGGVLNVWSNWSNIVDGNIGQSLARGAAYFLSGAVGSVVGITNPYLGSNITAIGNAGIALASGKLPQIKNFRDFAGYAAKELAVATLSTLGAKLISGEIVKLAQKWGWFESGFSQALTAVELAELAKDGIVPSIGIAAGVAASKQIIPEGFDYMAGQAGRTILKGSGTIGKGGLFVIGDDAITLRNAARLADAPEAGLQQVLLHGENYRGNVRFVNSTPKELARELLEGGFTRGTPVRLVSCHTGVEWNGDAYQLSRYLRSPVIAPNDEVAVIDKLQYVIRNNGIWKTFFNGIITK